MNTEVLKPVWPALGQGCGTWARVSRFLEERQDLLDEGDEAAASAIEWLGRHSQAAGQGVHGLVAEGCNLVHDCITGKHRRIDTKTAGHGTEGCKAAIADVISEFEATHNVKVLHASECGSRMFGWGSSDSDFDIKLVYIHPASRYQVINPRESVRRLSYTCWANLDTANPLDITAVAWELGHYLELVQDTNPTALDCLYSPVIWKTHSHFSDLRSRVPSHASVVKFIQSRMSVVQATALQHLKVELNARRLKKKLKKAGDAAGNEEEKKEQPRTVLGKEYVIMLRSIAEVALLLEGADFPPPIVFADCWDMFCKSGSPPQPPAEVIEWAATYLDLKHRVSKYDPAVAQHPRSPVVEAYIAAAYTTLHAAACTNETRERFFRKPLAFRYLNDLFRSHLS